MEPAPSRHIRGRVINGATGLPASGATVRAAARDSSPIAVIASAKASKDGTFDLGGLVPTTYFLSASEGTGPLSFGISGGSWSTIEIADRDMQDVALVIPATFDIPGKIVIEGTKSVDVTKLRPGVSRERDVFGMPVVQANSAPSPTPDGMFKLTGIGAGDLRVTLPLPSTSYLKSVKMGLSDFLREPVGVDTTPSSPLVIVVGSDGADVVGTVVDAQHTVVSNSVVALVPDITLRYRLDLFKSAATNAAGQFQIQGVAPGDYKLFAFDGVEFGAWTDPEFLQTVESRGVPIRVAEGSRLEKELTVVPGR